MNSSPSWTSVKIQIELICKGQACADINIGDLSDPIKALLML